MPLPADFVGFIFCRLFLFLTFWTTRRRRRRDNFAISTYLLKKTYNW